MRRFTPAYPPELRVEAAQLVRDGDKPLAEIASDLQPWHLRPGVRTARKDSLGND